MDWDCPRCDQSAHSYKALATHFRHSHGRDSALLAVVGANQLLNEYEEESVLALADKYGVSRTAVKTALKEADREIRGRSEAAKLRAERDPTHHQEIAPLGSAARLKNGMEGMTGKDHPTWRGGKDVYDAVKKQLHSPSWKTLRKRYRADQCKMCGTSNGDLDLHHIVPLLAGGTNEPWNLMTLCRNCHTSVEWYTRELVDPVLIDDE